MGGWADIYIEREMGCANETARDALVLKTRCCTAPCDLRFKKGEKNEKENTGSGASRPARVGCADSVGSSSVCGNEREQQEKCELTGERGDWRKRKQLNRAEGRW